METVLVVLAAFVAFGLCSVLGAVGLARWRLGHRNRVDPSTPSPAPLRWLASPGEPARLHRRVRTIARVGIADPGLDDFATAEMITAAVQLDRRVVLAAATAGADRRVRLRSLRVEVRELETLTERLTRPSAGRDECGAVERLRLLADARDEIDAVDHAGRILPDRTG